MDLDLTPLFDHHTIIRLRQVTFPLAHKLVDMVEENEDNNTLRVTQSLIQTYINNVALVTIATLLDQEIHSEDTLIYRNVCSQSITMDDNMSWTQINIHNLVAGIYLLELGVHNLDRDSNDPCFIKPWICGDELPIDCNVYHHNPKLSCHEFTLRVPIMLIVVKDDQESLSLLLEQSSNVNISDICLVSQ